MRELTRKIYNNNIKNTIQIDFKIYIQIKHSSSQCLVVNLLIVVFLCIKLLRLGFIEKVQKKKKKKSNNHHKFNI